MTAETEETAAGEYFARLYKESDDPWLLRDRWYERRKRALTLAALPDARYERAYEPGCATGELTLELAGRCDTLLAADLDPDAVNLARRRIADRPNVQIEQRAMPDSWPDGTFDLIIVSEVAYYLTDVQLTHLAGRVRTSLKTGGTFLACHWRRSIEGWPFSGDHVHARLSETLGLNRLSHYEDSDFLLDVWSSNEDSVHRREAR